MTESPPHADDVTYDHDASSDDHQISPNMLDRLVKHFVIEASCPDCGRRGYFINSPDRSTTVNCKEPTCNQVFLLV